MSVRRARQLMADALVLLDDAGWSLASARLQQAIDALRLEQKTHARPPASQKAKQASLRH